MRHRNIKNRKSRKSGARQQDARVYTARLPGGREMRFAPEVDIESVRGSSKTAIVGRVVGQLPHDRLFGRGILSASQHAAAERMHGLYTRSGLVPVKSQALEKIDCGQPESPESVAVAKALYFGELKELEPREASIVHSVCGEGLTCGEWAAKFSRSRNLATEWLCSALAEIAKRHGL